MMYEFHPQELIKKIIGAGFTQSQVAEQIGISQPSLSRILTGVSPDPRLSTVRAIEKFYNEKVKDKA
ncbi:helix-turn-helix transcriptional regulator [Xenorhabdus sp. XENO-10]|uniref:Helix-turn-helix transcriptional regulator n=1 Tax=Xenorhabdus yunnanensis TaxID=3025878 RepID=A0ABT5LF26_9GAMM|nr:helix-turn-helix transcriptional regulator [Xenorhabdus yunnanensis]MDC9589697.1 helix-turn-helix transcriptional regulator [Xenorhabdus yunnanensis]